MGLDTPTTPHPLLSPDEFEQLGGQGGRYDTRGNRTRPAPVPWPVPCTNGDVGILNTEVNRWLCARQSGWFGFRTDGALDPLRLLPVVLVGLLQQEVLLGLGLCGEPHRHHGLLQTACFLA